MKTIHHHWGTVIVQDEKLGIVLHNPSTHEENKQTMRRIVDYLIAEEFIPSQNYVTEILTKNPLAQIDCGNY
jgi:hypothetical protein